MKLTISGSKKYLTYLKAHLAEEHPKTRGHLRAHRGQLGVIGIVMTFVGLVVLIALMPVMSTLISDAHLTGMEGMLLGLIPSFLFIGLLISLILYVYPQRDQGV
jgi:uncharacterized BrkB/YihY/UPF0761 family membrane protein